MRARSLARASNHPPLLWSSARELAALHSRLGHVAEAATWRVQARVAIETVTARICDPALRRSFLGAEPVQRALAGA